MSATITSKIPIAARGLDPAAKPKRHAIPVTTIMLYLGNNGAPVDLATTYATKGIATKVKSATISWPRGRQSGSSLAVDSDALKLARKRRASAPIRTAPAGPSMDSYERASVRTEGVLKPVAKT